MYTIPSMVIVKKLFLIVFSCMISMVVIVYGTEIYVQKTVEKKFISRSWTYEQADYTSRNIFWLKSFCKRHSDYCNEEIEKTIPFQVTSFPKGAKEDCQKFVFLGDSFTHFFGITEEKGYSSIFSKKLSEITGRCVRVYRLATGGTGTDQQLQFFSDVVDKIRPSFVIWQFYANDYYDNIQQELYFIDRNNSLSKRMTWNNSVFLAGIFNFFPDFIVNSATGNFINYSLDTKDIFHYNSVNVADTKGVISYNEKKVPLLINKMEQLASDYNFNLLLTIAPLEINFTGLGGDKGYTRNFIVMNHSLEQILSNTSLFLPMSYSIASPNVLGVNTANEFLFLPEESPLILGGRHLSIEGNSYFGSNLLDNFLIKNQISNNYSSQSAEQN